MTFMTLDHPTIDSMSLLERQFLFAKLQPRLIEQIYYAGFKCTLGETWRTAAQVALDAAQGIGVLASVHPLRLAIDINLFDKNNQFLTDLGSHRPFGQFWKLLHPLCRWGGDFSKPDGNHYSVTYQGRA